jgi:hypothetical protein
VNLGEGELALDIATGRLRTKMASRAAAVPEAVAETGS